MNVGLLIGILVVVGVQSGVIYLLLRRQDLLIRALLAKTLSDIDPKKLVSFGVIKSDYTAAGKE